MLKLILVQLIFHADQHLNLHLHGKLVGFLHFKYLVRLISAQQTYKSFV